MRRASCRSSLWGVCFKIALSAREPFVDLVRNDMSDAAEIVRPTEVLLAAELCAADHVPKPERGRDPAVGLASDPPGHKRLSVDGAPIRIVRDRVEARDFLNERGLIDRHEQPAALEVGSYNLRNRRGQLGDGGATRQKNLQGELNRPPRAPG